MKLSRFITNEDGSVLVISIIILALVTVIGIAATSTTSIELQIAGNDRVYKNNFYQAEGAAMMLARVLEDIKTPANIEKLKDQKQFSIPGQADGDVVDENDVDDDMEDIIADIANPDYWGEDSDLPHHEMPGIATNNAPRIIVMNEGIASGSSAGMTEGSNLYQYAIFGRREANNGAVVIAIGYKKRY